MDRRLTTSTAIADFIPAEQNFIGQYGVWHDIHRTRIAMPGETVASLELTGPNGPLYAAQPDADFRPKYAATAGKE